MPDYYVSPRPIDFWADYGADSPIWTPAGNMIGLLGLPLSEQLRTGLRRWQAWFETYGVGRNLEDYPIEFHKEGRRLLLCVRSELGPGWTVRSSWYDEGGDVGSGHDSDSA